MLSTKKLRVFFLHITPSKSVFKWTKPPPNSCLCRLICKASTVWKPRIKQCVPLCGRFNIYIIHFRHFMEMLWVAAAEIAAVTFHFRDTCLNHLTIVMGNIGLIHQQAASPKSHKYKLFHIFRPSLPPVTYLNNDRWRWNEPRVQTESTMRNTLRSVIGPLPLEVYLHQIMTLFFPFFTGGSGTKAPIFVFLEDAKVSL